MDREARRRKIVERGSDRMSIITGQFHGQLDDTHDDDGQLQQDHLPHQAQPANQYSGLIHQTGVEGQEQASAASLEYSRVDNEVSGHSEADHGSRLAESQESQSGLVTAKVPETTYGAYVLSNRNRISYFTPKKINSCILSSENTRVVCSIMIALLVVFSHSNLPHHVIKSKSIIASRPLYVLLLTDVSIVVARLILAKRRGGNKSKRGKEATLQEDTENWDGAVKLLELGLVFYQSVRATFIDCSFYMVIVICGLSLW